MATRRRLIHIAGRMWNQPYLETCCRAALHRLHLCGPTGRPPDLPDASCLQRLAGMGLCEVHADGRYRITPRGTQRHTDEILVASVPTAAR